jgi:hypothetical protein
MRTKSLALHRDPIFKIGLLICLLGTAWILTHRPTAAGASAAPAQAHTWTLTPDALHPDQDGYLSPVLRAPFTFTAAAVHLQAAGIAAMFVDVELRLKADGGDWSPWQSPGELEPQDDGRLYGEDLVAWPQAREVQARVYSPDPLPEALQDLTLVAINAQPGPITAQATQSAQARAATTQDDPGVPQPTLIRRADWGADESWMSWPPEYAPVEKLILHHTASGGGDDPAAEVRAIYYYHAVVRGWGDIGYNFLVDKFGNVYEGRSGGLDVIGGHAYAWNEGSLGISVLGCYDSGGCSSPQVPTAATLDAIADLAAWTSSRRWLDPRALRDFDNGSSTVTAYVLAGHRDYGNTLCPGGNLYAELPNLRSTAWERLPEYDARFGWHDTPTSLVAGQQVDVHPNLYNYGRLGWRDDGGVYLGYRWLQDGQVVAENTAAAHIIPGVEISFGEMTALVAQLTAPSTPGDLTLRWDLYREGVGWFGDQAAPAGRSQPLEWAVEVAPAEIVPDPTLDVYLDPPAIPAGASVVVNLTLDGPAGQAFEAYTHWPPGVSYVAGSAQGDCGTLTVESAGMRWSGVLETAPVQASFAFLVPDGLLAPLALSTSTTLDVVGYPSQSLERWVLVNGLHSYLPFVGLAQGPDF